MEHTIEHTIEHSKKTVESIVFITLTFVPLIFVPIGEFNDFFYAPKVLALTGLMVVFLWLLFKNRRDIGLLIEPDRINIALLIYFSILLISLFFASNLSLAIQGNINREEGFGTLIVYALLFLAARNCSAFSESHFSKILISASIIASYGILQYYNIDPFPRDFIRTGWVAAFSTIGNPNFLGSFLVLMLPFAYYLFIHQGKKVALLHFALLFWCLLATNTRGTWIGALCSVFVFVVVSIREKKDHAYLKRSIIMLTLALVLLVGFNSQSDGLFTNRLTSISKEFSNVLDRNDQAKFAGSYRIYIWTRVIDLIQMRPWFGFGIENLQIPFVEYFGEESLEIFGIFLGVDKAHNEYLHIAVSSGIPSLVAYLTFIIFIISKYMKSHTKDELTIPLFTAVMGYLAQAFFNISVVSVAFIFWAYLGVLTAKSKTE